MGESEVTREEEPPYSRCSEGEVSRILADVVFLGPGHMGCGYCDGDAMEG
jgi:hypothetical protein